MRRAGFGIILFLCGSVAMAQQQGAAENGAGEQQDAQSIAREIAREKGRDAVPAARRVDGYRFDDFVSQGYALWTEGRFEQARQKFEQALALRPQDETVRNLIHQVEQARLEFESRQLERQRRQIQERYLQKTGQAWLVEEPAGTVSAASVRRSNRVENPLERKAAQQMVSVDFSDAQLQSVLDYLSRVSGINIVIDEAAVIRAGTLTIQMKEVSLLKALESILRSKGMGYRFEDGYIWVTSRENIVNEGMETRVYKLSQGLATFTRFATFNTVTVKGIRNDAGGAAVAEDGTPGADAGSENGGAEVVGIGTYEGENIGGAGGVAGQVTRTIKEVLMELVDWPQGSRIFLDPRTSTLIVRNTPSTHLQIEKLLDVLDVNPPQVMIEARFVEVGADDTYDLGLNLSPVISASGASRQHSFPFNKDSESKYEVPLATNVIGQSFFLNDQADAWQLGTLDFSKFTAVLKALESKGNSNLLSSPKVTTISGQEAVIKVVQEFRYPTKYKLEIVSIAGPNNTSTTASFPVPDEFTTRDIGIILKVLPNVGADGKTINLTLVPEVSEFDKFQDYGSGTAGAQRYLQPFFSVRSATASIVVNNNDTVVMGGLMRETLKTATHTVPFLGKVPLLGKLFTNKSDERVKRNLLIFITAHILAPSGEKVATSMVSVGEFREREGDVVESVVELKK
ncbi:MAG: hypothetical protein NC924_05130 [Candidatus Omnitrophica bacterium]|nr:hypothetical protein [Candidatus Omnitrophota bacterium]